MSSSLGWFSLEIAHKCSLWYVIPVPWVFSSVKMTMKINVWNVYCLNGQRNSLHTQQTYSTFCSWTHWIMCRPLRRDLLNSSALTHLLSELFSHARNLTYWPPMKKWGLYNSISKTGIKIFFEPGNGISSCVFKAITTTNSWLLHECGCQQCGWGW